jgi:subtilisin family serine protease
MPTKDGIKTLVLLLVAFSFCSCAPQKTKDQVFAENDLSALTPACREQVIPTELLVRYRDGRLEKFHLDGPEIESELGVVGQAEEEGTRNDREYSSEPNALNKSSQREVVAHRLVDDLLQAYGEEIDAVEYNKKIKHYSGPSATPTPTWATERIGVPAAHAQGYRGLGTVVAIIDSRAELSHPLYRDQILVNTQELDGQVGVDDDGNGYIDDIWGWDFARNEPLRVTGLGDVHGTHVTGIVAQVAPQAGLLPLAFITSDGYGSLDGAIQAMRYAKARGAHVINASWGGNVCSVVLEREIRDLSDAGVFFVAASGNSGLDLDLSPQYPAVFQAPLSLTVAASRVTDYLAAYSNTSYRYVHLAAPGSDVYSSLPNGSYGYLSGTSMAAPFVSGSLAVLRGAFPNKSHSSVRATLLQAVDRLDYRVQSEGRLNLQRAVELMRQ